VATYSNTLGRPKIRRKNLYVICSYDCYLWQQCLETINLYRGKNPNILNILEGKKWGQYVFYRFISKHLSLNVFCVLIFPCSYYMQWDIKQKEFSKKQVAFIYT